MAGPSSTTSSSEATPLIPSLPELPHIPTLLPRPPAVVSTLVSNSVSEAYRFRHFVAIILLFLILFLSLFSSLFFGHSLFAFAALLLITLFHALFLIFVILFRLRPTWIPKRFLLSHFAQGALVAPVVVALVGLIGITFATGAAVLTDFAIVAAFKNAFPEAASAFAHDVSNLVRVPVPMEAVVSTNMAMTAATAGAVSVSAAAMLGGDGGRHVLRRDVSTGTSRYNSGDNVFERFKNVPSHVLSRTTLLTSSTAAQRQISPNHPTRKTTTMFIPPIFSNANNNLNPSAATLHMLHTSIVNPTFPTTTSSSSSPSTSSSSSSLPPVTTRTLATALHDYVRHVMHSLLLHQHQQSYTTTSTTTLGSGRIWKDMLAAGATPASLLSMVVGFIVSLLLFYGVFGLGAIVASVIWMQYKLLTHFFKSSNLRDHLLQTNPTESNDDNGGDAGQSFHAGEVMTMTAPPLSQTSSSSSQQRQIPLLTTSDVLAISLLGATGFSLIAALVNLTILIDVESWLTTLLALAIVVTDTLTIGAIAVGLATAYAEIHVLNEPKRTRVWTHMARKTFVYCFGLAVVRPFIPGQYGGPSMLFVTIVGACAAVRFVIAWHYGLGIVSRFNRMYVREQTMLATMGRRGDEGDEGDDVDVVVMTGSGGGEGDEGYGKTFDA